VAHRVLVAQLDPEILVHTKAVHTITVAEQKPLLIKMEM
jgi:hypothetical protein